MYSHASSLSEKISQSTAAIRSVSQSLDNPDLKNKIQVLQRANKLLFNKIQHSNYVPVERSATESHCSEESLPVLNDEIVRQSLQNLKLSYKGKQSSDQKALTINRKNMTKEAKELALSEFYRSKK